jgi:LPXTG-motif cell wall-anchored protein
LIVAASSLFVVMTIVGSAGTSGAQTTETTTYAPTPTTAPATTAAPATTIPAPSEPLPVTGTNVETAIAVGAAAIAIGGLIVLAVRARQRRINVS